MVIFKGFGGHVSQNVSHITDIRIVLKSTFLGPNSIFKYVNSESQSGDQGPTIFK